MIVKRVGPVSFAKIAGALYAIMGFLFGGIISLIALARLTAGADSGGEAFAGFFGAAAVVVLPIMYGCLGFVMTLIMAALYNFIAGAVGGVEVDLQ